MDTLVPSVRKTNLTFRSFQAYPIVFRSTYDFSFGQAGMVFIAPFIGNVLGVALYFGYFKPAYTKKEAALKATNANIIIPPEARLPGVLVSATLVPIGMFWFALTARKSINPFVPIASGIPVGAGMTLLQLSLANYYIDLYPTTSASALAGNVTMRNLLGTVFPVIATPLYEALGNRNASLLLAGISVLGVPAGVVLVYFGKRIRKRSRWAKKDDLLQAQEMAMSGSGGSALDEKKPSHVPQRPDALVRGDSAGYPEELQQPLGAKPGEQTGETERVTTRP
jgi:DHA1 family multidrug resistance protein-like MFS transporter